MIYGLTTELAQVDEPPESDDSSSESEIDPEEQARNEALGLGGADLKAVMSEISKSLNDGAASNAGPAKGGEVLAVLTERTQLMSGDPSALALHHALMRAAGRPYAEMLVAWMRYGKLKDPYEEFCVKENSYLNQGFLQADYIDEYWEKRFAVSRDQAALSLGLHLCSCETALPWLEGPSGNWQACLPLERQVDDCPEGPAYQPSLNLGNIRSY